MYKLFLQVEGTMDTSRNMFDTFRQILMFTLSDANLIVGTELHECMNE